jgi:type VI secretion system protein ImpA
VSSISSTALNPFSLENLPAELARWVLPLPNGSYGPDLEYDNAFLQLVQAASGKPETQFEEAQSPDWQRVESLTGC